MTSDSGSIMWRRERKDPAEVILLLRKIAQQLKTETIESLEDLDAVLEDLTDAVVSVALACEEETAAGEGDVSEPDEDGILDELANTINDLECLADSLDTEGHDAKFALSQLDNLLASVRGDSDEGMLLHVSPEEGVVSMNLANLIHAGPVSIGLDDGGEVDFNSKEMKDGQVAEALADEIIAGLLS